MLENQEKKQQKVLAEQKKEFERILEK